MSDSEEEEKWEIEDICGHIRKSELIKKGDDLPYDEDDLKESKCPFAFRVKWVGYEGNDTWQSYESLKDDKKKARRYARIHGIEIVSAENQTNSDEQMTPESDSASEEYFVDEICGHIRTSELLKEGCKLGIPFTRKELRETECQYAFRVKWVGFEGQDTWQSYESLNDEKKRAKDYARLNSLELFPNKKQVFNREEEIARVRAIEKKYKNREPSGSNSPPSPSNENKQIDKDDEEGKNRKDYAERSMKKIRDMKMDKTTTSSSSRVIVYPNVEGFKRNDDFDMDDMKRRKREKTKMMKEEKKKVETVRPSEELSKSRKIHKKKEYQESDSDSDASPIKKKRYSNEGHKYQYESDSDSDVSPIKKKRYSNEGHKYQYESDSDSDVSPIKKKRYSNEGHKYQYEKMEVRRSNERNKSNEDRSPKDKMKTQRKKIQESSSDDSDEEGMEWEREKIINHVTVKQVKQGREIEGREKLNWKKIEKSRLPYIFRVSYIGDGWKKRFEWHTIEELDDLPTLDKYLHTAKLDLPKNYASMMKKTKKVVDDDIFAAD